ncbi:MAG: hypothetical protein WCO07_01325 [bacterium]
MNITSILTWLSGKKSIIASLIITISAYFGSTGALTPDQVVLIGSIVTIIFGTASIATGKLVYGK